KDRFALKKTDSLVRDNDGMIKWGVKGVKSSVKSYRYGWDKRFVAGEKGKEYFVEVENLTNVTIEVVLSVDGLDILSGDPASYSKNGYLIRPKKTLKILGYRTGNDRVSAFKFSTVSQSYTNQLHGKARNVGVIGIAAFSEKESNQRRKWSPVIDSDRLIANPFSGN
ncbi:hypothetical protein OAB00_04620, partial [Akkermansiaceae bacterium]|nr:hypothetical protein [Akkermansiaceae bacterium]